VALKKEIAELTPGSSAMEAKKSELRKAENALAQIQAKWARLRDELDSGK